jgi:hypothetical protein
VVQLQYPVISPVQCSEDHLVQCQVKLPAVLTGTVLLHYFFV